MVKYEILDSLLIVAAVIPRARHIARMEKSNRQINAHIQKVIDE